MVVVRVGIPDRRRGVGGPFRTERVMVRSRPNGHGVRSSRNTRSAGTRSGSHSRRSRMRHLGAPPRELLGRHAPQLSAALAPTFPGLLVTLHAVPSETHSPVLWHQPDAPLISWRQYLLSGLVDDPRARHMARAPRCRRPRSRRASSELKKGFGLSRTSVRSVGTSCMVTCFTATSLSVRTPAG